MNFFIEGNKHYNAKEYEDAIKYYEKAVKEKDNEACSYYNAGVCFIKLKEYKKAITMIKNALLLQSDSKYYFNLGYCYAMLENTTSALVNFNMAWALNNEDEDCEKAINIITDKLRKNR